MTAVVVVAVAVAVVVVVVAAAGLPPTSTRPRFNKRSCCSALNDVYCSKLQDTIACKSTPAY